MWNNTTLPSSPDSSDVLDDSTHRPLFTISEDLYKNFTLISHLVLTPVICTLGLVGNGLGLGVLLKDSRRQKLSIHFYLCALTTFDILYLCSNLIRDIPEFLALKDPQFANFVDVHMQRGGIYCDMVISQTSFLIIIVMSIERLLAIVRPFDVKTMCIAKYPRTIVTLIFLFNAMFTLPFPLFLEASSLVVRNETVYFVQVQPNAREFMVPFRLVTTVVNFFVPECIILFTNIAIAISFSRHIRNRHAGLNRTNTGLQGKQTKLTATVFVITLMFFLLSLPNLFITLLSFIDKEYRFDGRQKVEFWFFIELSNVLTLINSSNDFVIYILVSDHYRRIFGQMYCNCRKCLWPDEVSEVVDFASMSRSQRTEQVNKY